MNGCDRHGGALDAMRRRFPDAPEPWLDLSTGINPWPWPGANVQIADLQRLPDTADFAACAEAMAQAYGAPCEAVLPVPGSELTIRLLPDVLAPRRLAILAPSYEDHARVWRAAEREVIASANPLAEAGTADAIVVCNPNNPDGRRLERSALIEARGRLAARGGWLIVDEAFAELAPDLSLASMAGDGNLLILRSSGKFFGLAGLRLGALLAPAEIRRAMAERLGCWSVSTPALKIGAAAHADRAWQAGARSRLAAAARRLRELLGRRGLRVAGGTDLFQWVETGNAEAVWTQLARRGISVRRFHWSRRHLRFGLPPDASAESRLEAALAGLAQNE